MSGFEILAVTLPSYLVRNQLTDGKGQEQAVSAWGSIALAAAASGHVGIADLQTANLEDAAWREAVLGFFAQKAPLEGSLGIKCGAGQLSACQQIITTLASDTVRSSDKAADAHQRSKQFVLVLVPDGDSRVNALADKNLAKEIGRLQKTGVRVLLEVVSVQEAMSAQKLGADGVIAKGHEAAGYVGDQTTFVLLQQCLRHLTIPVFAEGGIGLHTASACFAAGGAGVVLTSQLLLARESCLPFELKAKIETMDGTESFALPPSAEQAFRLYARPNHPIMDTLAALAPEAILAELVKSGQDENPLNWVFPLGQDVAFAGWLARRYLSVAGILDAVANAVHEHVQLAKELKPLAPGSPLAKSHGSEYPIVQGAMTRVSDTAEFAFEVAQGGGLPFLALSLMRKGEADLLLSQSQKKLGNLPWGVGILGFVPSQLRQEQLEVVETYKPPYALIAGGRPDQAKFLEEKGIKTYLHVPSPLLLSSFVEMGSRRFVFEGKECGGHVGPRSSFVLWESMIERLLDSIGPREDGSAYHVLFAGGVHDALSASMVAAMAAKLAEKGVKVGVLMGTAYLFTEEAVSSGAIVKKFQDAAVDCRETVLLETGPGHAIRCIDSPYKQTFDEKRRTLLAEGKSRDEVREELELMNLGRLRIASKGLSRGAALTRDEIVTEMSAPDRNAGNGQKLSSVSEEKQWSEGMYMIGQVAALHDSVLTIKELHNQVSVGGTELVEALDFAEPIHDLGFLPTADRLPVQEQEGIAIIGMSCLLPKAGDVETFWQNILNKVDTIEEVPVEQWDWRNYYDADPQAKDKIYSKWGGFLESIEFDPTKYGIPPSSLNSIDPMQILLLEVTDAALKDAGYENRPFPRGQTSVILANAGHGPITALYSLRSMLGWKLFDLDPKEKAKLEAKLPEWTEDSFPGYLGNVTAGRVANRFDLGGVNFSIDAACASSLAALHTAVAELRNGNSDVVLLAATDTHNQPGDYLSFSKTHAFSASGRCKTFDASADGIVISEGMAMLVLKRVSDARRDGDRIYAVIRGIGGSSDGRDLSLTAPRPAGQVKALVRAYRDASVPPSTVTLVEAHGTGTVAGDKAEVEALKRVFEQSGASERACALGSVKTMIGHTKAAAGLASLIKVAKALHHKVLPATIGVKVPNPACHFEKGPFYVNSETRPWILDDPEGKPIRRAGVSAFGFGGTNFHAVLEENTAEPSIAEGGSEWTMPCELFLFYGRNQTDLLRMLTSVSESVKRLSPAERESRQALAVLAHASYLKAVEWQSQRTQLKGLSDGEVEQCLAIVASSPDDLEDKLNRAKGDLLDSQKNQIKDPRGIYFSLREKARTGKIAFVFPGQGSQQVNMLLDLALQFGEVKRTFEAANAVLAGKLDKPLSQYIYPPPSFTEEEERELKAGLTNTQIAQPAIGAADMAVLSLLGSFGLKADMVAGHSYGEYVALYAAGCLSDADLLKISYERGRLLGEASSGVKGAMAAVTCANTELKTILSDLKEITIANINGPAQCVIAGSEEAIERALTVLKGKGVQAKRISVSQAFHSPHMRSALDSLRRSLEELKFAEAKIPVYSNTDGKVYTGGPGTTVNKLANHIVNPVDFVTEIANMNADGADVFVEVGPGNVLSSLVESILKEKKVLTLAVDRQGRNGVVNLLHVLGQLASIGVKIDPSRLYSFRAAQLARQAAFEAVQTSKAQTNSKRLVYAVNSISIKRLDKSQATTPTKDSVVQGAESKQSQPTALRTSTAVPSANRPVAPVATAPAAPVGQGPRPPATRQDKSSSAAKVGQAASNSLGENLAPMRQGERTSQISGQKSTAQRAAQRHSSNVDQVMIEFQQTMLQMTDNFLKTQQNVMLAYLNAQQAGKSLSATGIGGQDNLLDEQVAAMMRNAALPELVNNQSVTDQSTTTYSLANESASLQSSQVLVASVAPPAEAAPAIATAESNNGNEVDPEFLVASLLDIVSQRTGYPTDMLDPSLDLEADLGIDSIKRVEILNSFRRILPESKQRQLEAGIEELAGTKTLQGIIDWLRSEPSPNVAEASGNGNGSLSVTLDEDESSNGNGKHPDSSARLELQEISSKAVLTATPALRVPGESHNGGNGNNGAGSHDAIESGADTSGRNIKRAVTKIIPLPFLENNGTETAKNAEQSDRLVIVTADQYGLHALVSKLCEESGLIPVVLQHDRQVEEFEKVTQERRNYRFNLTDSQVLKQQLDEVINVFGKPRGLVHLKALDRSEKEQWQTIRDSVLSLFLLVKHLGGDLLDQSGKFASGIVAATGMGGSFGLQPNDLKDTWAAGQAGIVGLMKSAGKELTALNCKAIDFEEKAVLANSEAQSQVAAKLFAELCNAEPVVEVAYKGSDRFGLAVESQELAPFHVNGSDLNAQSVVLITGGARGITAEIAQEFAERYKPRLIIIGRSNRPEGAEDLRFASLNTPRELKGVIIDQLKSEGKQVTIPVVEAQYQALVRDREIRGNLERLEAAGARVEYYALDVRDSKALAAAVKKVYQDHGKINVVVHGAGVIEDAFIKDKTPESFLRVFETKVLGAFNLTSCLKMDALDHLILFSSVVGRTGNAGQADYVAANEVVNKLALSLQAKVPGRVTSIMWGPWKGGMAQPELESIFASYGWAMIDANAGRDALLAEMLHGKQDEVEVLLVAELDKATSLEPSGPKLKDAKLRRLNNGDYEFSLEVNTHSDIFLADHTFDGVPVMPMAFALEFMSEAVASVYPGREIRSVENLDIPAGIVFESNSKMVFITVHQEELSDTKVRATASLSSGLGQRRSNFKASFVLDSEGTFNQVPSKVAPSLLLSAGLPDVGEPVTVPPVTEIYGQWLFHGPIFQGIKEIHTIGAKGVVGTVTGSVVQSCFRNQNDSRWQFDPIMIDSAMQLGGIWARRYLDITVLPTGFKRLQRYAHLSGGPFTVRLFMAPESNARELTCDLAVYDQSGHIVLLIEGLGGVGSKSLNRLSGGSTIGVGVGR